MKKADTDKFKSAKLQLPQNSDTIFDPDDNLYNFPAAADSLTLGYPNPKTQNNAKKIEKSRNTQKTP